jgi:hypothetical protein
MPRVASRYGVNVAGALPFQGSEDQRIVDLIMVSGVYITLTSPWLVRRHASDVKNGDIDLRANELTPGKMRNLVAEGQY